MNPEYKIYEEIDRYLRLEMSMEELKAFEERLVADTGMQEILDAQKFTNELIVDRELVHLKNRMQQEMNGNDHGMNRWTKTILLSSTLLLAGGGLFMLLNKTNTEKDRQENIAVITNSSGQENVSNNSTSQENNQTAVKKSAAISENTAVAPNAPVENTEEQNITSSSTNETTAPLLPENKQENNPAEPVKIVNEPHAVNCSEVTIQADAKVVYGFQDEAPRIVVNQRSVHGGAAPYSYSLDNKNYTSSTEFDDVQNGSYTLYIRDQHQCTSALKKIFTVKKPVEEIDESFSPAYGNSWNFPLKNNTDGTITIFNKTGSMVYQTRISGGYPNNWDGRDNEGRELESGNYVFIINFANNDSVKGHISIVR